MDCLNKWGIPYDEICFGKPWGQFYIDDLAVDAIQYDLQKQVHHHEHSVQRAPRTHCPENLKLCPLQIGFYFPTEVQTQPPTFIGAIDIKKYKPIIAAAKETESIKVEGAP